MKIKRKRKNEKEKNGKNATKQLGIMKVNQIHLMDV
tara:strand:+ start:151 stop:258 length:108 start_codon:yes stop_codon:yes gene_type:complete